MAVKGKYPKYANGIAVYSEDEKNSFCHICPAKLVISSEEHLKDVNHQSIFNYYIHNFTDIGPFSTCKLCSKSLEYSLIIEHAVSHKLIPWYRPDEESKIFFTNFISTINNEYYCHVCCVKLSSWFHAISHTEEASHQDLRKNEINIETVKEISFSISYYKYAINKAIFMEKLETLKCALCFSSIDTLIGDICDHISSERHGENEVKFLKTLETSSTRIPPIINDINYQNYSDKIDKSSEKNLQITFSLCTICNCIIDGENIESHLESHNFLTKYNIKKLNERSKITSDKTDASRTNQYSGITAGISRIDENTRPHGALNHAIMPTKTIRCQKDRKNQNTVKKGRKAEKCEIIEDSSGKLQIKRYTRENEIVINDLPEEIKYISDIRSRCTLCECKITTLKSIMEHVNAAPHQKKLQAIKRDVPNKSVDTCLMNGRIPKKSTDDRTCCDDIVMHPYEFADSHGNSEHNTVDSSASTVFDGINSLEESDKRLDEDKKLERKPKKDDEVYLTNCDICFGTILGGTQSVSDHVNSANHRESFSYFSSLHGPKSTIEREPKLNKNNSTKYFVADNQIESNENIMRILEVPEGKTRDDGNYFFWCDVCNQKFYGNFVPNEHLKSAIHSEQYRLKFGGDELSVTGNDEIYPDGIEKVHVNSYYFCRLCNREIISSPSIIKHVNGKSHNYELEKIDGIKRIERIYSSKNLPEEVVKLKGKYFFLCTICNVMVSGPENIAGHVDSSQHKDNGKKVINRLGKSLYECEICDHRMSGFLEIILHLSNGEHRERYKNCGKTETDVKKSPSENSLSPSLRMNSDDPSEEDEFFSCSSDSEAEEIATVTGKSSLCEKIARNNEKMCIDDLPEGIETFDGGDSFFCTTCIVELNSRDSIDDHVLTNVHKNGIKVVSRISDNIFECKACNQRIPGNDSMRDHLVHEDHTEKMWEFRVNRLTNKIQEMDDDFDSNHDHPIAELCIKDYSNESLMGIMRFEESDSFWCTICQIKLDSEEVSLHVCSAEHKTALLRGDVDTSSSEEASKPHSKYSSDDDGINAIYESDDSESAEEHNEDVTVASTSESNGNCEDDGERLGEMLQGILEIGGTDYYFCTLCDADKAFEKKNLLQHFNSENHQRKIYVSDHSKSDETGIPPNKNGKLNRESISEELSPTTTPEKSKDIQLSESLSVSNVNTEDSSLQNGISESSTTTSQLNTRSDQPEEHLDESMKDIFRIEGTNIFVCLGCKSAKLFSKSDIIEHVKGKKHLESKMALSEAPQNDAIKCSPFSKNLPEGIINIPNKVFVFCTLCKEQLFEETSMTNHVSGIAHRQRKQSQIRNNKKSRLETLETPSVESNELLETDTIQHGNSEIHPSKGDNTDKLESEGRFRRSKTGISFDTNEPLCGKSVLKESSPSASSEKDEEFKPNASSSVSKGSVNSCSTENGVRQSSTSSPELNDNLEELKESLGELSENIFRIDGTNVFFCIGCDASTAFSESDIIKHLKGEIHLKCKRELRFNSRFDHLPEGIVQVPHKELLFCRFCKCKIYGKEDMTDHVNEQEHQQYVNDEIMKKLTRSSSSLSEGSSNCFSMENDISQSTSSSSQLNEGLDEIKESLGELMKDIFRIDGTDIFFCIGCDTSTVFSESGIIRHVKREIHSSRKRELGYKVPEFVEETSIHFSEGIIKVPNKRFLFCKFCKCKLNGEKAVAKHVSMKEHRDYVSEEIIEKLDDSKAKPTETSFLDDLPDGIEKFSNNNCLLCTKCRIEIPRRHRDVEQHMRSETHKNMGMNVVFKLANDQFDCRSCDMILLGYLGLVSHLSSKLHETRTREKESQVMKFIVDYKKNREINFNHLNSESININNVKILSREIIRIEGINENWCTKCNYLVFDENLKTHQYGRQHQDALKGIGATQDIQTFHCELCDSTVIGKINWNEHEQTDEHRRNEEELIGVTSSELPVDESQTTGKPMISSFQLSKDYDDSEIKQSILDSVKPDTKIYPKHEQMVECNICHCRIRGGDMNISDHRNSKEHKDNEADLFGRPKPPENKENSIPNASKNVRSFSRTIPLDAYYKYHYRDDNMIDFIECKVCDSKIYGTKDVSANLVYASHVNSEEHMMKEIVFVNDWRPSPTPSTSSQCSDASAKLPTEEKKKEKPKLLRLFEAMDENKSICTVCREILGNKVLLHSHMTNHFWQRFTRNPPPITEVAQMETAEPEPSEPTEDFDEEAVMDESPKETRKPSPKKSHFRKKPLDIEVPDSPNIYEIDKQKMNEVKAGVLLSLPKDNNTIYCLICRCDVSNNLQTFYEHLCSVKHLDYLMDMLGDDKLFQDYENQFSDLALGYEYIEDISDYAVKCHACNISVNNKFPQLLEHINSASHVDKWRKLDRNSKELFRELRSRMESNFYSIRKYWCVICSVKFITEYEFQKHLKEKKHLKKTGRLRNEFLMFDYCGVCASLWYGFLKTFSYHSDCPMHKYHKLDGFFSINKLPESAERLLNSPENEIEAILKGLDFRRSIDRSKENQLLRDLREIAVKNYPKATAHPFGSRITGLAGRNSDLDVFLDCPTKKNCMYFGEISDQKFMLMRLEKMKKCLENNANIWHIDREIFNCRIPIIKTKHKPTGIECDLSFANGLTVENTALIKNYCDKSSDCRKLIIFIKDWMNQCEITGANGFNSYSIAWLVIYFLQTKKILPTVNHLIKMKNKSQLIAGWETGVSHNFKIQTFGESFGELLNEFFKFYANFDYRNDVICPLLGEIVKKVDFQNRDKLPSAMWPYSNYLNDTVDPVPFSLDSIMCLQDPFELSHNLTKAVKKFKIFRFKTFCCYSAKILDDNV